MNKKISKIFAFLKRYAKHPLYVTLYGCTFFLKGFGLKIQFYNNEELLGLLKRGKSIIRLGDGDIVSIPLDLENCYHRSSKELKDMYTTIIKNYHKDSPYILSVPKFLNMTNTELKNLGERKLEWCLPMKVMFVLNFNKDYAYADAHNFYYDNFFEKLIDPLFREKRVIFISNRKTIEKQKRNKNLPWRDVVYVESPEVNAMDAYIDIKHNLNKALIGTDKKDVVIYNAMGPVGKYIVYEYANRGYQGIDIGKVSEVMFTGESIQYLI